MPVSTGLTGEPRAKRCKLCDESSHRSDTGSGYWQLQLDRDLVDTISSIYPEWFKNSMAEGGGSPSAPRESPPKAVIDTSPILMDQNKESLKVKLLLRRPFDQLVAQGIMPPHKTPAAFHGQRRQLERAKTGDMLKAKIQQRPPRQELERRHILEADPNHVDPSLAERQRMLKKARLADQLNDQLSHRPGPLELIQKNILHTEEPIEQAVKTGRIPYKATSEGQLNRPQLPSNYINPEEDSQSSEGDNTVSPGPSDVIETAAKSAGIVVSLIQPALNKDSGSGEIVFASLPILPQASASSPASLVSSTSTLSPLSSVASPVSSLASPAPPPPPPPMTLRAIPSPSSAKSDAPGKDKNRKKSKSKSAPKARTIKFHEYKGPPSAQKTSNSSPNPGESSYDLLLKQQTLLLQFQLQLQHKYPQIILPASQRQNSESGSVCSGNLNNRQMSPAPSSSSPESLTAPARITGRLEDMKVSDLKAELKRRNLPVSGSKPQLIERLKPFSMAFQNSEAISQNSNNSIDSSTSMAQIADQSPPYPEIDSPREASPKNDSISETVPEQMDLDPTSPAPKQQPDQFPDQFSQQNNHKILQAQQKTREDIVREQQKQIEELQRELTLSQLKLQAATRSEPKAQMIALQKHLQARQQQQQQQNYMLQMKQLQALQAKQVNEEQQKLQQQQHVAFQNQKNRSSQNLTGGLVLNGAALEAALFNQLIGQGKNAKVLNGETNCKASSAALPNFLNLNLTPIITAPNIKAEVIVEDLNMKSPSVQAQEIKIEFCNGDDSNSNPDRTRLAKPPPLYEEATKLQQKKNKSIKSQIIDDVLEILIKNGELPPSAANDPSTPGSAGSKTVQESEPIYPSIPTNAVSNDENPVMADSENPEAEAALGIDPAELLDSLDTLDSMDFSQLVMELGQGQGNQTGAEAEDQQQIVPMDTDDWLESLLPSEDGYSNDNNGNAVVNGVVSEMTSHHADLGGYDPLLGIAQEDPFDPFNLEEFRSPGDLTAAFSWDKVDYSTA